MSAMWLQAETQEAQLKGGHMEQMDKLIVLYADLSLSTLINPHTLPRLMEGLLFAQDNS